MNVHDIAARTYGASSDAYERGRPSYPPDAVACVVDALSIGASSVVVDLAAGTGKLTRLLVPTGARVVAVEPVEAMRATLVATVPDIDVVAGAAEALPFAAGSLDALLVAQAFHWFSVRPALVEAARVVRHGGGLALLWNQRDESVPWVAELSRLMRWRDRPVPSYEDVDWAAVVGEVGAFSPLEQRAFANEHEIDADALVDRVLSTSHIGVLASEEQAALADRVRQLVAGFPERFPFPHRTEVFWCHRR
ncbi:MAG TPA: class I SAM-dependent methyltransferase [Acidimicrobiales bacterium]|nr:class I SAM-dependent methyltransferase [Acidimicrobiales bacterium]